MQQLYGSSIVDKERTLLFDRIAQTVSAYNVRADPIWAGLVEEWPSVEYFATDLDPRSFERVSDQIWRGRADLLLNADEEIRPGQIATVSFTLPVDVELRDEAGRLSVVRMQRRK
jgi:hypothetical protein